MSILVSVRKLDWWYEKIGARKLGKTLYQKCGIGKSDKNQCEVQVLS